MTNTTFQASCLRAQLRLMMPSAESKNMTRSNYTLISLREREVEGESGSQDRQCVLYMQSSHPTFTLGVQQVMVTDDKVPGELAVSVLTREVERAWAGFSTQTCRTELTAEGLHIESLRTRREDGTYEGTPVKELKVRGTEVQLDGLPRKIEADAVLMDMVPLLDGLRAAVEIASTRGNGLKQQGVRITLSPTCLCIEGENPIVNATTHYEGQWLQAPEETRTCLITTDAVRHLIAAFSAYGVGLPVRFAYKDHQLTVQCDNVTIICDVN